MQVQSSQAPQPSSLPWGVALAALSVLLVGGGLIIWAHQDPTPPPYFVAEPGRKPMSLSTETAPLESPGFAPRVHGPDSVTANPPAMGVHSITLTQENGTKVVKIQVTPGGDEIIVDAATGRVIETRPGSSAVGGGGGGRFAAPFIPAS
jgi:hypothetical protein